MGVVIDTISPQKKSPLPEGGGFFDPGESPSERDVHMAWWYDIFLPKRKEAPLESEKQEQPESLIINEVQLLLAEKRTSLASMRTGIAVFALPLSVMSVLIATSKYYDILDVIHLAIPVFALCAGLVILGIYLTHRAVSKIRRYDDLIHEIKQQNRRVDRIVS